MHTVKNDSKALVNKFMNWGTYGVFSLIGIFIIVFGNTSSLFIQSINLFESIIIGFFAVLFGALAFEKWKQQLDIYDRLELIQENIEKLGHEHEDFFKMLYNSNSYKIIKTIEDIQKWSVEDISAARNYVRATSFGPLNEAAEDKEDYYLQLALKLKSNSHFRYTTAYNNLNVVLRKKAFVSLALEPKEYNRMSHFKFEKQLYKNVLIIDDRVAYFGFPTHLEDGHMQIAVRISNVSSEGSDFIKELISWYDNYIPCYGTKQDSLILFGLNKP